MKKIVIVNNNMKVGGVQKSLSNLLWAIADYYDITLYLFCKTGEYLNELPPSVKVVECSSLFKYLGVSQAECAGDVRAWLMRGALAALCKVFGRSFVIKLMMPSQTTLPHQYDVAISYLHNGNVKSFYGGVNEFVLSKVKAERTVAFLHCDYEHCGANCPQNNELYHQFDAVAACSEGCRRAFLSVLPELGGRCTTVSNFHRYDVLCAMAQDEPVTYEQGCFHVLVVGRLAHEKAVDRAVRAVAHVIDRGIPAQLHIVGDGNQRASLEQLAYELGIAHNVVLYGEQSNPYRYMAHADMLLVTSHHEAAPMVIDEAYALGLPVLTVETTSSQEMVADRGVGWVCENSQEALNSALLNLLQHPSELRQAQQALRAAKPNNARAQHQFELIVGE